MAKDANTATRIDKNPLGQALGAYLRRERDHLRKPSHAIAAEIEIGSSFYRMIEAGSANLHPSRILRIIQAFPNSGLEFNLLSKYIVGLQMIETSLSSYQELMKTVHELMAVDAEFERLLRHFNPLWDALRNQDTKAVKQFAASDETYYEVREFLTNRYYTLEPERRMDHELNELIDHTPTFYLEFALNTLKSLQVLPVNIFFSELWRWEKVHMRDFSALYGMVLDHHGISDYANLKRYQYKYLWESQFQQVHFLFPNSPDSPEVIKETFAHNLKTALQEEPEQNEYYLREFDMAMDKVAIKTFSASYEQIQNLLHPHTQAEYNALWIFVMVSDNNVGFLSYIHPDTVQITQGTSLRYKDTLASLKALKQLWNAI